MPLPLREWHADRIWKLATGKGVRVAVIDSGVAAGNLHFAYADGAVVPGTSTVPPQAKDDKGNPLYASDGRGDQSGHGTAVASIIAGRRYAGAGGADGSDVIGLAYNATIVPVQVFVTQEAPKPPAAPVGPPLTTTAAPTTAIQAPVDVSQYLGPKASQLAEGIRWAATEGKADVIAISMSMAQESDDVTAAVQLALDKDIVVVASAGDRHTDGEAPDGPRYPAAQPGVIGVGALRAAGHADPVDTMAGDHVSVAAPGQAIPAANARGYDCLFSPEFAATSYAVPYVAATAALLREEYPKESAAEIRYRIEAAASRPNPGVKDPLTGWGALDPLGSLTLMIDKKAPGPLHPSLTAPITQAAPNNSYVEAPPPAVDEHAPARRRATFLAIGGGLGLVALLLLRRLRDSR